MSKPENEKLREEFVSKELKHWSSFSSKFVRIPDSSKNEIADWWLKKIAEREAESREKMIETISEDITNYDEVYISEDVRKAINRMKFNLKSIIKNKE